MVPASRSLMAGDRDHLDLVGVDVAFVGEQIVRNHIDRAGEQVVDRRRAAAIRHLGHLEAALEHQKLAKQVTSICLLYTSDAADE